MSMQIRYYDDNSFTDMSTDVLKKGQLGVYISSTDPSTSRISVGNGSDPVNLLPYIKMSGPDVPFDVDSVYPVGSVYVSFSSTSPASLFGGSWTQITDRFLYADSTSGTTGGATEVALSVRHMPRHSHAFSGAISSAGTHTHSMDVYIWSQGAGSDSAYVFQADRNATTRYTESAGGHTHAISGTNTIVGGGDAHNNMPPYITVYMWRRTG